MMNYLTRYIGGYKCSHTFFSVHGAAKEVEQGVNYYLGSSLRLSEFTLLCDLIHQVSLIVFSGFLRNASRVISNLAPFIAAPIFILNATIKHEQYTQIARKVNARNIPYIRLPEELSQRTISGLDFFMENFPKIAKIAILVNIVTIMILGQAAFSIGILTAAIYHTMVEKKWVPSRVSAFIETYMPLILDLGTTMSSFAVLPLRIFCGLRALTYIPSIHTFSLDKTQTIVNYFFKPENQLNLNLKEIEAECKGIDINQFDFSKILEILQAADDAFEINPPHYNQRMFDLDKLPHNKDFQQFVELFNKIDWEFHYLALIGKLKNDDRFLTWFQKNYAPETLKKVLNANQLKELELHVTKLFPDRTLKEVAIKYAEDQIQNVVKVLQDKTPVTGSSKDLIEAIEKCAIILANFPLEELKKVDKLTNEHIEIVDRLLKLAIEGGEYCAAGIRRIVNEELDSILRKLSDQNYKDDFSEFEQKIIQGLFEARKEMVQENYQSICQFYPPELYSDTHIYDALYPVCALGFYPLEKYEKAQVEIAHLLILKSKPFAALRNEMYRKYEEEELKQVINAHANDFQFYIDQLIESNTNLTETEKTSLCDIYAGLSDKQYADEWWENGEIVKRFSRLLFLKTGVLRFKNK